MNQELFEWLLLLGRWLHITVAVAWIGNSFFFMGLDRTLEFNEESKNAGHVGDLWMVHGGGFYHVEKMQMGPTKVPEHLHWFKWESYWTWMSGLFLLLMIFYAGSGTFLLDSSVSGISFVQALLIGIFTLAGSWFFYDILWESKITKTNPLVGHVLTILWFIGMAYLLCHTMSGRAAYIHTGAMLGTWMTANVFLRIIPRQAKMVEAAKKGEPVNPEWSKNAKNRSTHNTYFTLPVIFIMLSNHFPSTYGNSLNWVILLLMSAAGAAIREYFVKRLQNPPRSKIFLGVGLSLIAGVILFTRENSSSAPVTSEASPTPVVAAAPSNRSGTTLSGVVKFAGPVPHGEKLSLPLPCTTHHKGETYSNEILVKDGKLKNVVVRIIKGLEDKTFTDVPADAVVVDQRDCLYEPRVSAVRVGQKVEFINSDTVFHNVRSITRNNENFNVAMPNKDDRMTKIFDKPEFYVQTKCSVHPWMSATIAVMDNPYYGVSDENGVFQIYNVPPGNYTLALWHEVFGTQTAEVVVKDQAVIDLAFSYKKQKDGE
ncbi:MAG: urate hydroxylase PuuD [Bdellovibrionales bacterium]